MSKSRYVPNRAGLEALARGPLAQSLVTRHGSHLHSAAGDGFEASYRQGSGRFRGIIYPDTHSARGRNARDNVLVRLIG